MADKVEKNKVVEIHYTLRLADGSIEDTTEGEAPLPYLHGVGGIIPGLEKALEGRSIGDRFQVTVEPAEGYGEYDEALSESIPLNAFPEGTELTEGEEIFVELDDGTATQGIIERIDKNDVLINYNHPLAGETLTFDVEVVDVRDATQEELEHGHAHDPYAEDDEDDEEWDDDDEEWDDDDDFEEWDDDDDWEEDDLEDDLGQDDGKKA